VVFVGPPDVEALSNEWTISFSHEVLELLADPVSSYVHRPETTQAWMLEVCDPIEDNQFAYQIDGVMVSDFITPNYYDPHYRGGAVDFRGHLNTPYTILEGGYMSFFQKEVSDVMFQMTWYPSIGETSPNLHKKSLISDSDDVIWTQTVPKGKWWERDVDGDGDEQDQQDELHRTLLKKADILSDHRRHLAFKQSQGKAFSPLSSLKDKFHHDPDPKNVTFTVGRTSS